MRKPSWIFDSRSVINPKDFANLDGGGEPPSPPYDKILAEVSHSSNGSENLSSFTGIFNGAPRSCQFGRSSFSEEGSRTLPDKI